ncbi:MBL fold metallo-hydrolase [Antarctobacter sp.]|uniref:MBL fold metallo-hydrolase n=1 Tax=Antarctobacter sp. TaxID=1872577 RepID=UPI002B2668C1|nr:MBL fold metallo-hydrolase [Antarctobacter sp.]
MQISFHGAAGQVTGSCHLFEHAGRRILIDCGLFQGSHEADDENAGDFGFDPSDIDVLLLTHAHLDHCGRIPLLVKRGFRGEIISTAATRELARVVMLDSAHIQEEDAKHQARYQRQRGRKALPGLYGIPDALRAMDAFGRVARLDDPIDLGRDIRATFIEAGHILGSASVVVEAGTGRDTRRIVFSGDLGNGGRSVLPDPATPPEADYVVIESTYGDRAHRSFEASRTELIEAIRKIHDRGGNTIIPSFALERTQEILFVLSEAVRKKELPENLAVFLDSPMAISATEIFGRYPDAFQSQFRKTLAARDPFGLEGLQFTRGADESKAINRITSGAVIVAGSGMCTGGRAVHHLQRNLWREECGVIFVGYAAEGTLARRLVDGTQSVKIYGQTVAVKAEIFTINGFSAHADQAELLAWHSHTGRPKRTFVVHGDPDRGMTHLQKAIEAAGLAVSCPKMHESIHLD